MRPTTQTSYVRILVGLEHENMMPHWEIFMFMVIILLYFPDFSVPCMKKLKISNPTNVSTIQSTEGKAPVGDVSTEVDEP